MRPAAAITHACLVMAAAASGAPVPEAELHEHLTHAFNNPATDSKRPRVLLIGDSISIGYTVPVRRELEGEADVFRPPVNCQHTGFGLEHIREWLGTGRWDVIHFNFGIWDTHWVDAQGRLVRRQPGDPPLPPGTLHLRHTPEQYQTNLVALIKILKATGARLVWASTTPILSRTGPRLEDIPTLNRVAAAVMQAEGIPINDLYEFVMPHAQEWQSADQCHFVAIGNRQLGKRVAEFVRRALAGHGP